MNDEVILQTERLVLIAWRADQIDDVVAIHANPQVARFYAVDGRPWSMEKCENRLNSWMREYETLRLGKHRIVRKSDGALLGRAGFSIHSLTDEPELGYALLPQFWGQGYATEIAASLRDWIFRETEWNRFLGFAHEDNTASLAVLERIGMTPTHEGVVADMPCKFYAYDRPAA